jgi:hypothetical protein
MLQVDATFSDASNGENDGQKSLTSSVRVTSPNGVWLHFCVGEKHCMLNQLALALTANKQL